ncbi:MAG: hypothetical protein KFH87_04690 [Bacteroidetes bacterium]|nr:hypothetical protein [Bacteroidota bacterium]
MNRILIYHHMARASFLFLLTLGFSLTATAQTIGTSARLTGMGNSSTALVRGLDALNVNPAQLVPDDGVSISLGILPFGAQAGADFLDYATYERYFTGTVNEKGKREATYLGNSDKHMILKTFQGDVGNFTHDIRYSLGGLMISTRFLTAAFSITERTGSNIALPRSFAEFAFFGNSAGKEFDFSQTRVSSSWTRDYALTVAREFRLVRNIPLLVGASVKVVHGYGYFGIDRFNSSFFTDPDTYEVSGSADMVAQYAGSEDWLMANNDFHYTLFPNPVGSGLGMDIGAHVKLNRYFSAGVSLVDLGSVQWNRRTYEISANEDFLIDDVVGGEQVDELRSRLDGQERPISSFSTPLPSALIIGGLLTIPDMPRLGRDWHVTVAYRQGFNDIAGNSSSPRLGLGTEIELLFNVAFRMGVNFGGIRPVTFGAGVGFIADNFKLDIGTMDITPHLNESFSAVAVGISSHWDI